MTYRNMAVKVNGGDPIMGTRVGVDFSTKNQVKRQLAANIDSNDQLRFNGDVDCKISVDFLVRSSDLSYNGLNFFSDLFHGTGKDTMLVSVGGNNYSECYIDSFNATVKPFEPVMGNVTFSSYNPSSAGTITGVIDNNTNTLLGGNDFIYGHDCSLVGTSNVVRSNMLSELTYTKTYSRSPVYTIGSKHATNHLVDGVEVDMTVQSTGLNSFIDFSGSKLTSTFGVLLEDVQNSGVHFDSADVDLTVSAGAHVTDEGYSVDGGGTLVTKATIKEVIL